MSTAETAGRPVPPEDAVLMRQLRAAKAPLSWLAWLFETSLSNVHLIVTGKTHKDAGGPVTEARGYTAPEEIVRIREMRASGMSYREMSEETGRSEVALRGICSGRSFADAGGPLVAPMPQRAPGKKG